LKEERAALV
jgi:hypothetical protein